MSFTQRVIDTRTTKGINQLEWQTRRLLMKVLLRMAKAIGLDVSVYNRIEKGLRDCRVDELVKIADVLEVSKDYLLGPDEGSAHVSKFAERLLSLRNERGITQEDVGKILGLSPSTIGMYEQGRRAPNLDLVCIIANKFNTSADYLLGLTDERNSTFTQSNILVGFNNAPTHIKAAILTLLAPYEKGGAT